MHTSNKKPCPYPATSHSNEIKHIPPANSSIIERNRKQVNGDAIKVVAQTTGISLSTIKHAITAYYGEKFNTRHLTSEDIIICILSYKGL